MWSSLLSSSAAAAAVVRSVVSLPEEGRDLDVAMAEYSRSREKGIRMCFSKKSLCLSAVAAFCVKSPWADARSIV
jgi:hypothetical protein